MGYYNGTANDMAALRTALVGACVSEGWTWNGATEVLSKGVMFLRLQVVSGYLTLLGRTSASAGDMPNVVRVGALGSTPVTFPLTYEVFVFAGEVYLVVSYSLDYYQWCAFGKSTVQGLVGSGMWVGASGGPATAAGGVAVNMNATGGAGGFNSNRGAPAMLWGISQDPADFNFFVHSDLDSQGWWEAQTVGASRIGITPCTPLIALLPNAWNSEAVLLPIRAYKVRPSSKISLTADLECARYTRVDNYTPGEVITLGTDRWKIYPWYRKNTAARNGGLAIDHTGTFGWAIRYEGP